MGRGWVMGKGRERELGKRRKRIEVRRGIGEGRFGLSFLRLGREEVTSWKGGGG